MDTKHRVWQVVAQIPEGRVSTYGDVAELAGMPGAARRVGHVLKDLPAGSTLPWHRVVNARGQIALAESSGAAREQRERLVSEGSLLPGDRRVQMKLYRWNPSAN